MVPVYFSIDRHGYIDFYVDQLGVLWIPPWCWIGPFYQWLWGWAPDSESFYFRVLGLEVCWRYKGG
jgi:hypothetical protein